MGHCNLRFMVAVVSVGVAVAAFGAGREADTTQINAALNLSASQQVELRVAEASASHWLLETQIANEPVTIFLTPYSLRSADFEVLVQDSGGVIRRLDAPSPSRTVRGTIMGWDANSVTGSLVDGQFTGLIRTADRGAWLVQPLSRIEKGAPPQAHLCYALEDVLPYERGCGVDEHALQAAEDDAAAAADWAEPPAQPRGGATQRTDISFDADVEFFQANGSSIDATVDDIESVMVGVDDIYRAQTGISYVVNKIIVRTAEPDPYSATDSGDLLDQFAGEWEDHQPGQRDLAHLMTGKNLDGSIIGLAYVGQVCERDGIFSGGGYGLSQSRFSNNMAMRVEVTAHELGHNWNAPHCAEIQNNNCPTSFPPDCGIMCACAGGCNGNLTQFGQSTIDTIIEHRDSRDCLDTSASAIYVNASFVGPENGSLSNPYNTMREGIWAAEPSGSVVFFGGTYDAGDTIEILNRPMTLQERPGTGTVTIGQ